MALQPVSSYGSFQFGLPDDVWKCVIFPKLSPQDRVRAAKTCRTWFRWIVVNLNVTALSDHTFNQIFSLTEVRVFNIFNTLYKSNIWEHLATLPKLEKISLKEVQAIPLNELNLLETKTPLPVRTFHAGRLGLDGQTGPYLEKLNSLFPDLTTLSMHNVLSFPAAQSMPLFHNLRSLEMISKITPTRTRAPFDLTSLIHLKGLESLILSFFNISNCQHLETFPDLRVIHFTNSHCDQETFLTTAKKLEKLEELFLWSIEDRRPSLLEFKHLKRIDLNPQTLGLTIEQWRSHPLKQICGPSGNLISSCLLEGSITNETKKTILNYLEIGVSPSPESSYIPLKIAITKMGLNIATVCQTEEYEFEIVKALILNGADLLRCDINGQNCLHWAVSCHNKRKYELMKLLVLEGDHFMVDKAEQLRKYHPFLHAEDHTNQTPLLFSIQMGDKLAFRLLMNLGANPRALNSAGENAETVMSLRGLNCADWYGKGSKIAL